MSRLDDKSFKQHQFWGGFVRRNQAWIWIFFVGLFCLGTSVAIAQTITGSIRGTVTDPSGAVVAGANVTATNVATNVATQTVTNSDGLYNFQFLNLGDYTITATATGFNSTSIGPIHLQIDQIANWMRSCRLERPRPRSMLQRERGRFSALKTPRWVPASAQMHCRACRCLGRTPCMRPCLCLGRVNPTVSSMSSAYRMTSPDEVPSFNGNRQQGNNFVLDGIEINETTENLSGYKPNPFSLQEVRIITGNADAEYGNVDGAEILMVTKSGTNRFHGNAFEYFENENLGANSWGNNYTNSPKPKFHQNQFGGQVGGPIFKNRLFFFADYSGLRYSALNLGLASVPTVLERQGDFSEVAAIDGNTIFDTSNGLNNDTPYPNNVIPTIVNPVAIYLFAHPESLPLPNRTPNPGTVSTNDYRNPVTNKNLNNQGDGRVDYTLSAHDTLMVKGSYGDAYDYPVECSHPGLVSDQERLPICNGCDRLDPHLFAIAGE